VSDLREKGDIRGAPASHRNAEISNPSAEAKNQTSPDADSSSIFQTNIL
jgi:hypothetical protein